jgi:hypothetical protein
MHFISHNPKIVTDITHKIKLTTPMNTKINTRFILLCLGLFIGLIGCHFHQNDNNKSDSIIQPNIAQKQNPIELFDLICLFAHDLSSPSLEWANQANNPDILWSNSGILMSDDGFYRHGQAIVSVNNQLLNCLDVNSVPCKWDLVLSGSRCGYNSCLIQSIHHQAFNEISLPELFKGRNFNCKVIDHDDFTSRYTFSIPGKTPFVLSLSWSCGSAGCSLKIICDYE